MPLLIAVASLAIGMVIASRLDMTPRVVGAGHGAAADEQRADWRARSTRSTFRNIAQGAEPDGRQHPDHGDAPHPGDDRILRRRRLSSAASSATRTRGPAAAAAAERRRASPRRPTGAGTGFIIDKAGLILTNNHVVEDATKITVEIFGEDDRARATTPRVVGRDPLTDSALIELVEKPSHGAAGSQASATPSRCSPATG